MKKKHFLTALLSVFMLFNSLSVMADSSAAAQLQGLLEKASSLKGQFEQKLYDRDGHLLQTTEGRFAVQRPGNFYWETLPPYEQLVVGDSETLWVYDPDLEQVTVHDQTRQQQANPAQLLSGSVEDLEENYDITVESDGNKQRFTLMSKGEETLFQSLQLFYSNGELSGLQFMDNMGQITELNFSEVQLNPELDAKLFQFEAPAGVDVIIDD